MERIANFACNKSRLIIVVVVILNIVALTSFIRFNLDTDFLNFFTSGNPRTDEYNRLNEKYQTGETVVVLIEQDSSLLDERYLQEVFRLQENIEEMDGVHQVQSFVPSEILVQGTTFDIDQKFIAYHADLLEDFIQDNLLSS